MSRSWIHALSQRAPFESRTDPASAWPPAQASPPMTAGGSGSPIRSSIPCTMLTWWMRLPRKPPENATTESSSSTPTACFTCAASSARVCSMTSAGHVRAAREILGPEVRPELRVVHEHADVAQPLGRAGQLRDQPLVGAVEAVVVADLDDPPGAALGLDDRVDVLERDGERLLDEDVEAGGERLEHDARVGRVGRPDDDAVEPRVGDRLRGGRDPRGDAEPVADALAHRPARVGDDGELEAVAQERQVRQVHGLADQAGADHPDLAAVAHDGATLGNGCRVGLGRIRSAFSRMTSGTTRRASSIESHSLSTRLWSARSSPRRASSAWPTTFSTVW